jgi:hypothetical protein
MVRVRSDRRERDRVRRRRWDAETVAELLAKNDRDVPYSGRIGQLLRYGRWLPA